MGHTGMITLLILCHRRRVIHPPSHLFLSHFLLTFYYVLEVAPTAVAQRTGCEALLHAGLHALMTGV